MAEKTEKLVSVEMTEAQKLKVVDILAKDKEAKEVEGKSSEVRLLVSHRINGVPYGPGTVTVPQAIAGTLLSNDQSAIQARLKEMTSDNNMIEILGRGLSRIHKGGA